MVTDKQKELFNGKLGVVLDIENINISDENRKKHITWLKNVYYKYLNNTLPEEHKKDLEDNLQKRNITREEFLETKGNLDMFITLYKSKEDPKQETIEELENELAKLSKKHTPKGKILYRLTDEEYNEIGKQISELEEKIKELSKKLSETTPKEEIKEEKVSNNAQKKIEELIVTNKQKDAEIVELKNELAKQREERAFYSNKYREEAERELEIHKKQLEDEFDKRVKNTVEEKIIQNNHKEEGIKEQQKNYIRKRLLEGKSLSLEDIKSGLKDAKISTNKLDIALNELRIEIPGIVRKIDNEGLLQTYSIGVPSTNILETYKKTTACPRISNVFDGTVKFILDADPHIPLECTEDEMKKAREPFLQYSSLNDNIPIIGLGDYADTDKNINYTRWQKMDPEAIKYSYRFYKYFAKAAATAPKTKHYVLLGNHDEHTFLVGMNPVEIMNDNSDNIIFLGADKGAFMLGNDKIGVFHGLDTVALNEASGMRKAEARMLMYNRVNEEIKRYIKDYIYALIAHYHQTIHNPLQQFSLIYGPALCTAEIEDGHVKRIFIQSLHRTKAGDNFVEEYYPCQTEIYNSNYQYKKKKSH